MRTICGLLAATAGDAGAQSQGWILWLRQTFDQSTTVQLVLWIVILASVAGIAFYALRRLREQIDEDESHPSEMLSDFREMHLQGGLSDAEFRTIKTVLGAKLQQETKQNGDKG